MEISLSRILSLALTAALLSSHVRAETTRKTPANAYKSAVVRIDVTGAGLPIAFGSGFFVSESGKLVTNFKVIQPYLMHDKFEIAFRISDGTVLKDFEIAGCGDERKLDLCLLKLKYKPKVFLNEAAHEPAPGQRVFVVNHPRGSDVSVASSMVTSVKSENRQKMIYVAAPSRQPALEGPTGGPVLNDEGDLVGMTVASKKHTRATAAIAGHEIIDYEKRFHTFRKAEEYRADALKKASDLVPVLSAKFVFPAQSLLRIGSSVAGLFPLEISFRLPSGSYSGHFPSQFSQCQHQSAGKDEAVICSEPGQTAFVAVRLHPNTPAGALGAMDGKPPVDSQPTTLVTNYLRKAGRTISSLTPDQKALFVSNVEPAKCGTIGAGSLRGKTYCSTEIKNQINPDSRTALILFQDGTSLVEVLVTSFEPSLFGFYKNFPTLFVDSTSVARAPASGLSFRFDRSNPAKY